MNDMQQIQIHKITVNIGIGEVGDDVEKAVNLLEEMTESEAIRTESGMNAAGFGVREGLNIGAKTTLRGEKAENFLQRMFDAIEENISISNFDKHGNFSFGVEEYINVPGMEYNPDIGMRGFEVAVTLERPGFRVKRRKENQRDVGKDHMISPQDAANYIQETFDVDINGV